MKKQIAFLGILVASIMIILLIAVTNSQEDECVKGGNNCVSMPDSSYRNTAK